VVDIPALVQGQHLQVRTAVGQLVGGKDARLAAAQDHYVIHGIHGSSPYIFFCFGGKKPRSYRI
jgi:hypothetical protein